MEDVIGIIRMGDADGLPDYALDTNAVLNDKDAAWRYGAPQDYSQIRASYEDSMQSHILYGIDVAETSVLV